MPIYEYRCRNGHEFEVFQSMSEDPVTALQQVRRAGGARVPPRRRPLQGLGLLHHRLREVGGRAKPSGDGKSADSDSGKSEKKSDSGSKSEGSGDKAKAKSAD